MKLTCESHVEWGFFLHFQCPYKPSNATNLRPLKKQEQHRLLLYYGDKVLEDFKQGLVTQQTIKKILCQ